MLNPAPDLRLAVLACLLLLGLVHPAGIPTARADKSEQAQRDLEQVRSRIAAIKREVERSRNERDELGQALAAVEKEIGALGKQLHDLKNDIDARRATIRKLDRERQHAEDDVGQRLDSLHKQLRLAYMNGQQSKLRVLLSQSNPEKMGRMLAYYDYFADAQVSGIRRLQTEAADLTTARDHVARQRDALQTDEQRLQKTLAALRNTESAREAALREAEQQLARRGRSLITLEGDEQRLENLIGNIRKQLASVETTARTRPLDQYKGRLTPPLKGRKIAHFGQSKPGGKLRWQGVWLEAGNGTPVQAAAAGRVVYAGWMHRYGLIAVLDHGNDFYTLYGHAQSVFPEIGDWVQAGETIAAAGNSGGHRQTGIYFEIRRGKTPLNPAVWLPRG